MTYDADAPWPQPTVLTLYVARPLDLPPLTAQAAFDSHRRAPSPGRGDTSWVVESAFGELVLDLTQVRDRPGPPWPYRQTRGLIQPRRTPLGIPVELEVSPWSDRRCEIGIRPSGRTVPMHDCLRRRRYFALAVEATEALARALEDEVHAGLAAQLDGAVEGAGRHVTLVQGSAGDAGDTGGSIS